MAMNGFTTKKRKGNKGGNPIPTFSCCQTHFWNKTNAEDKAGSALPLFVNMFQPFLFYLVWEKGEQSRQEMHRVGAPLPSPSVYDSSIQEMHNYRVPSQPLLHLLVLPSPPQPLYKCFRQWEKKDQSSWEIRKTR